jgi:hypothetical protein
VREKRWPVLVRGKPPRVRLIRTKIYPADTLLDRKEKGGKGGNLRAPIPKQRQTKRKKEFSKRPFAGPVLSSLAGSRGRLRNILLSYRPTMTAIKTTSTSKASYQDGMLSAPVTDIPPSATEEEAKTRYISALSNGVNKLLERGHGRERASTQLLNEIADGCVPDEDEVGNSACMFLFPPRRRAGGDKAAKCRTTPNVLTPRHDPFLKSPAGHFVARRRIFLTLRPSLLRDL